MEMPQDFIGFSTILILFAFGAFRQEENSIFETFCLFFGLISHRKIYDKKMKKILAFLQRVVYNSFLAHPCTA